jgi:hypothetical protein
MHTLTNIYEEIKKQNHNQEYEIFLDMDGVLCDFDNRFKEFSGLLPEKYIEKYNEDSFWRLINKEGVNFWSEMKWMNDGKLLWNYTKKYNPTLLSAPSKKYESRLGKQLWVKNNIPNTKLILTPASNKKKYSGKNKILIDDREDNIEQWVSVGGIGIHHTSSINSIEQLKKLNL